MAAGEISPVKDAVLEFHPVKVAVAPISSLQIDTLNAKAERHIVRDSVQESGKNRRVAIGAHEGCKVVYKPLGSLSRLSVKLAKPRHGPLAPVQFSEKQADRFRKWPHP